MHVYKHHWNGNISDSIAVSPHRSTLIAGPCMLESESLALRVGSFLKEKCLKNNVQYIFKSSFDKANRTSGQSQRGPGIYKGVETLHQIKETLQVPILTDIHTPEQAQPAAQCADILQIPAFLCLDTELIISALRTKKVVQIKKGQHTSVQELVTHIDACVQNHAIENPRIMICERGSSYGYHNLVVDMRNLILMRQSGYPTVFDATHSAQLPGAGSGSTAGLRQMVPGLARAAVAIGVDVLFAEVHEAPEKALSDSSTQLHLETAEEIIRMMGSQVHTSSVQEKRV